MMRNGHPIQLPVLQEKGIAILPTWRDQEKGRFRDWRPSGTLGGGETGDTQEVEEA